jgi:hypothetical protein
MLRSDARPEVGYQYGKVSPRHYEPEIVHLIDLPRVIRHSAITFATYANSLMIVARTEVGITITATVL